MIRGIIFDLDGLLLDSEIYWERARRAYCGSVGCTWGDDDELAAKGKNSREWAALIEERCGVDLPQTSIIDGVTAQIRALYGEALPLLPGAVETVDLLYPFYPLALASSSPPALIEYALTEAGVRDRFSVVVSSDDVGVGKPDPAVFVEAARQLHVPTGEIAVFEDSTAGIGAARAAGMHIIAVPNQHYPPTRDALAQADVTLDSLTEFTPALLDGMAATAG